MILNPYSSGVIGVLCLQFLLPLNGPFIHTSTAQAPALKRMSRNTDGMVSLSYTSEHGFYYTLWRTAELDSPPSPVSLSAPLAELVTDKPPEGLRRAFYRLTKTPISRPRDADGDTIDDIFERDHLPLDPFDPEDANTLTPFGITHLENYHNTLTENPTFSLSVASLPEKEASPPPQTAIDLDYLIDVDVVNNAASDYTPSHDGKGFLFLNEDEENLPVRLANPTLAGFQYPGNYYIGIANDTKLTVEDQFPNGDIAYDVGCDEPYLMSSVTTSNPAPNEIEYHFSPLYYQTDQAAPTAAQRYDFDIDPALEIIANTAAEAGLRSRGGVDDSSHLVLTETNNDSRATVIFPNQGSALIHEFRISMDLRIGGGTDDPADGLSINLVRPNDPLLQSPRGVGYASSPNGAEIDLPEEGSQTGFSLSFDSWHSGEGDVIGISIRKDGMIIDQRRAETKHGALTDASSLQTGPLASQGWARLQITFEAGELAVHWKDQPILLRPMSWNASPGRLVIGARTGLATQVHHLDNVELHINPNAEPIPHTGERVFSSDLDPTTPGVVQATWNDIFPDRPVASCFRPIDKDGNEVGLYARVLSTMRTTAEIAILPYHPPEEAGKSKAYSVVPLDPEPLNMKTLIPDPDLDNEFDVAPLRVGFFCETLTLVEPWPVAPGPAENSLPTFTGNVEDCRRVYVATYEVFAERSSNVVEFPLVDGTPVLHLRPKDGPRAVANVLTSPSDPRRNLQTGEDSLSVRVSEFSNDLDASLKNQNLLPLQDLDNLNSNDFGLLQVPETGITVIDATLLEDTLTTPEPDLVGLPETGAQTGTFRIQWLAEGPDAAPEPTMVTGFGASIARSGTFPWIRSKTDDTPDALAANHPTGLRANAFIASSSPNLTAHSLEFSHTGPEHPDHCGINLRDGSLTATARPVRDPLAGRAFTTDLQNDPLGYLHLLSPRGGIALSKMYLEAITEINLHTSAPLETWNISVSESELVAVGDLNIRCGHVTIDGSIFDASRVWIDGTSGTTPNTRTQLKFGAPSSDSSGSEVLASMTSNGFLRLDGFELFDLAHSRFSANTVHIRSTWQDRRHVSNLHAITIESQAVARVYSNHTISITDRVTIENGQVAAQVITVEPGATLELTGPNAGVFTNTHNYGHGDFGTLLINGVSQSGNGKAPSFHRRPHFDDKS